jgi:hypothetical protein
MRYSVKRWNGGQMEEELKPRSHEGTKQEGETGITQIRGWDFRNYSVARATSP